MTTPQLHRDRALVLSSMYGEGDHPLVRKKWSTTGNNHNNKSIPTGDPPIKPSEVDEDCSETSILSYGDEEDVSSSSSSLHVYEIKEVPAAATLLPGKERTKSLAQLYNTNNANNNRHFVSDGAMRSKSTVHLSPPSRRVWKTSGRTARVGTPVNRKKETSPIPSHDFSRRPLKPSEIARQERSKSSSLSSLRNFSNPSVAAGSDRPLFQQDASDSSRGWSSTRRNWKSVRNLSHTKQQPDVEDEEERTQALTVDTEETTSHSSDAGSDSSSASIAHLPDFSHGVPSSRQTTTTKRRTSAGDNPYVRLLVDDLTQAPRWS